MTIKKKIEIIEAMNENALAMYDIYKKDGDEVEAIKHLRESMAYDTVLRILKDNKSAETYANIFDIAI